MKKLAETPIGLQNPTAQERLCMEKELQENKLQSIRAVMPFSSENKYSAVAVTHLDDEGQVMKIAIYIKGAPEVVMGMCPHALSQNGIIPINQIIHES